MHGIRPPAGLTAPVSPRERWAVFAENIASQRRPRSAIAFHPAPPAALSFLDSPRLAELVRLPTRLLESRRLPVGAALLAALLTAPSLGTGLATEDWVMKAAATDADHGFTGHVNLFGPARPSTPAEVARRAVEFRLTGVWPWTADDTLDVSFFRPLASLTHLMDYRLWPAHPALMHLQSIAWYAALAAVVALLHRRIAGPTWAAGLAAVLYAADDAHGHAVGWIINRSAPMAAVFGVLSLLAYDRLARERWKPGAVLAPLLLALSLLSAEYGLSIVGYFVAYTLLLDRAAWSARGARATLWVVTTAVWATYYRYAGHAVHGSGLYVDPLVAPVQYAGEVFERAAVLTMGLLGAPFSDTWTRAAPYAQGFVSLWAVAFVWAALWILWPRLRRDPVSRFWALGAGLSLLPACSTFAEDRLLFFAGIGGMPLVVEGIRDAWASRHTRTPRRIPALLLAAAWVVVHGIVAPVLLPVRSRYMSHYESRLSSARESAFSGVSRDQMLVLLNGEDFYFASMMAQTRLARGEPYPARMLLLAGTPDEVEVTRDGDATLSVRPRDGFVSRVFNRIYRSEAHPMQRRQRLDLGGIDVEVADTSVVGEPLAAVFRFAAPLEGRQYQFRSWNTATARYEPVTLPAVGTSVVLRGTP